MLSAIERCSSEVSCVTMPILRRRLSWRDVRDVLAVDQDAAALDVVEAQQQVDERRLARARASDQARPSRPARCRAKAARSRRRPCRSGTSHPRSGFRRARAASAGASGTSSIARGLAIVRMPSCTWPILSNMPIAVHITQPDMVTTRTVSPIATAMSPRRQRADAPQPDRQGRRRRRSSRCCRWRRAD